MSIVVENLIKTYGSQRAVDNISFNVKKGEVLGFLGPNGAGKSTTMRILTCYFAPNAGTVRLGEYNIYAHADQIKQRIGYLPESNPLYTDMYIVDYLKFCATLQGVAQHVLSERVRKMFEVCGLKDERHKKIGALSKGYRQRVGIAQAMIHDPEVLILDEPTSGLDPNQIIEIRKLIKDLAKEKTIILSSHILSEVQATCDRILIINKGRIVADGTAASLQEKRGNEERLRLKVEGENLSPQIVKEKLLSVASVASVEEFNDKTQTFLIHSKPTLSSKKSIFDLCVQEKWYIDMLLAEEGSLEDVFAELTRKN